MTKKNLNIVGIMSGTSMDGVDYVLCRFKNAGSSPKIEFLDLKSVQFSAKLLDKLHLAAQNKLSLWESSELHFELGEFYSKKLKAIAKAKAWKIDLIGLHGQTVYHRGRHSSLQLGDANFLSQDFNCPVVSNFRAADVALGGHGAPLAPFFHKTLLLPLLKSKALAFHNLGGISNLTYLKKTGSGRLHFHSFDTGPANILMNLEYMRNFPDSRGYDRNGLMASKGTASTAILTKMLKHPFLRKKFPKSCGREEFGEEFLKVYRSSLNRLSVEDRLATLCEFSALTIADAYSKLLKDLPETIYFSGGGVYNRSLMSRIQYYLPDVEVKTSADLGWPANAIEGGAFALLAGYRYFEMPLELKPITGARKNSLLGQVTI